MDNYDASINRIVLDKPDRYIGFISSIYFAIFITWLIDSFKYKHDLW